MRLCRAEDSLVWSYVTLVYNDRKLVKSRKHNSFCDYKSSIEELKFGQDGGRKQKPMIGLIQTTAIYANFDHSLEKTLRLWVEEISEVLIK